MIEYRWRDPLSNEELNALYAASWPRHTDGDVTAPLERSLGWVGAREDGRLIGFVHLAWDGGGHAFILDTTVHPDWQRRGIGRRLVEVAVEAARERGLEWVHVDFEPHLRDFYASCGFRPTDAGLIRLR